MYITDWSVGPCTNECTRIGTARKLDKMGVLVPSDRKHKTWHARSFHICT